MSNPYPQLRRVTLAEGISFVVLLLVGMPLKYGAQLPIAVSITGAAHGVLFVWFMVVWQRTWLTAQWSLGRAALVFAAALLPFGPFVFDRRLRSWEQQWQQQA